MFRNVKPLTSLVKQLKTKQLTKYLSYTLSKRTGDYQEPSIILHEIQYRGYTVQGGGGGHLFMLNARIYYSAKYASNGKF